MQAFTRTCLCGVFAAIAALANLPAAEAQTLRERMRDRVMARQNQPRMIIPTPVVPPPVQHVSAPKVTIHVGGYDRDFYLYAPEGSIGDLVW